MSDMPVPAASNLANVADRADGVSVGVVVGFTEQGVPLVDFPGNPQDDPLPARSTAELRTLEVGRPVVLVFEMADLARPIVIGPIVDPSPTRTWSIQPDGERIEITAEREIVLRCGSASITLTRAGKVLIRGGYVSSHSTGVNKIKGGAVHIN